MTEFFRTAKGRYAARILTVAIISYILTAYVQNEWVDWNTFAKGLAGAVGYALLGLLVPQVEPFVGIKAKEVQVPREVTVTRDRQGGR